MGNHALWHKTESGDQSACASPQYMWEPDASTTFVHLHTLNESKWSVLVLWWIGNLISIHAYSGHPFSPNQENRLLHHVGRFGISGIVALGHHPQGADAVRIVFPRQLHHLKKGYLGVILWNLWKLLSYLLQSNPELLLFWSLLRLGLLEFGRTVSKPLNAWAKRLGLRVCNMIHHYTPRQLPTFMLVLKRPKTSWPQHCQSRTWRGWHKESPSLPAWCIPRPALRWPDKYAKDIKGLEPQWAIDGNTKLCMLQPYHVARQRGKVEHVATWSSTERWKK